MASSIEQATTSKAMERSVAAQSSPAAVVRQAIEGQGPRFQAVLPAGFDATRFQNLILTAVKAKPGLMECFTTEAGKVSVLLAAMSAAEIGLEPDTPMQEAWLLPRRNQGRMECQLSIGYQGYIKLARRSGEIKALRANVVREGDEWVYEFGLEEDVLKHKPAPAAERGELLYAYAIARYKDGGYDFVVLDRGEVESRRARSDSWKSEKSRPYSPWTTATDSMWRKSAVRELAKWIPKSAEFARVEGNDEQVLTFGRDGTIAALPPANVDGDTGEIIGESFEYDDTVAHDSTDEVTE